MSGGRRWGIIASATCLVVGLGVLGVTAVIAMTPSAARPSAEPVVAPPPPALAPLPEVTPLTSTTSGGHGQPITDLVDPLWVAETAAQTGIPAAPLAAYAGASLRLAAEAPSCGLGWNTLAGIGMVESEHGTINGSSIGEDGVARPAIIGIPLTGETTLAIRDTDAGALDGDTVWDRAVGPMQFIPTTWDEWASDGDGDGESDPQNIYDSSLAAARYLCDVGGDLSDPQQWIAAIHAYNPTVEYNNRVAEAADHYGAW